MAASPGFEGRLVAARLDDRTWQLEEPLVYHTRVHNELGVIFPERLVVPAGFITDFASTPRWLPKGLDVAQPAAAVHDMLYGCHMVTREVADAILFEAMGALGEDPGVRRTALRWGYWTMVRAFGWYRWRQGPDRMRFLNGNFMVVTLAALHDLPWGHFNAPR